MPLIRVPKSWEILDPQITSEAAFVNRRRFMTNLIGAGVTASLLPLTGCKSNTSSKTALDQSTEAYAGLTRNPAFAKVDRAITDEALATKYNNFYEYGGTKSICSDSKSGTTVEPILIIS